MMTRETKMGLVVSCSFLCLVGVVVYTKLNEGGRTDPSPYLKADGSLPDIPEDPAPVEAGGASPLPGKDNPDAVRVNENSAPEKKEPAPVPLPPNMIDAGLQRTAVETPSSLPNDLQAGPASPAAKSETNSFEGFVPTQRAKEDVKDTTPPNDNRPSDSPSPSEDGLKKPETDFPKPPDAGGIPLPMAKDTSPGTEHGTSLNQDGKRKNRGKGQENLPESALPDNPRKSASDETREQPMPTPFTVPGASEERKEMTAPVSVSNPAPGPWTNANHTAAPASTPPISMPSPGMVGVAPAPDPEPMPKPMDPPRSTPISTVAPVGSGSNSPVIGGDPPKSDLQPGGIDSGKWEPKPPLPVIGSAPESKPVPPSPVKENGFNPNSVLGSPNPVPAVTTSRGPVTSGNLLPEVDSYDEETYLCMQGDSFEEISLKFYQNKKYAQALSSFNRNHPRAAAALAQNPPILRDGLALFIPPARILEKQYGRTNAELKPATSVAAAGMEKTVGVPAPAIRNPVYRVVGANEMVSTIARETLGDMNRWNEIYQLNKQNFDPSRPIPAGTVLVLPADAQVRAQNEP
jgi:hypothetical protein